MSSILNIIYKTRGYAPGFIFFAIYCIYSPHLFQYSQIQQTFFYDRTFILDYLGTVGGPASLLGLFIQQFCVSGMLSVLLVSVILAALVAFTYWAMGRKHWILSFALVSVLALYLCANPDNLRPIAAYFLTVLALSLDKGKCFLKIPFAFMLYYLAGDYAILYALATLIMEMLHKKYLKAFVPSAVIALSMLFAVHQGWSIPFSEISAVQPISKKNQTFKTLCCYHAEGKWDKVIEMGKKSGRNTNTLFANFYGYSLAKKGRLIQNLNRFGITEKEFLIMNTVRMAPVQSILSDIYYSCGCVAKAQRFAFEANEGLGGYSPRLLKTLVNTNLIMGYDQVAEKYMRLLDRTLFYHNCKPEGHYNIGTKDTFCALLSDASDIYAAAALNPENKMAQQYQAALRLMNEF